MTSSRGELFERLSLIADLECAISHDIESIIFYLSDLRELKLTKSILEEENSDIKEIENKILDLENTIEKRKNLLLLNTNLRRKQMSFLEKLNKRDWCSIKHFAPVVVKALEIWQASEKEEDFLFLVEIYKVWSMKLSLAFNIDYNDCYRCLSDKLKEV